VGLLHSIQYVPSPGGDRLFVAATSGVFMMSVANPGVWVRAGTNLPNAVPRDLDYDSVRQTLVVALFGRGVFALPNAPALNQAPHTVCKDATVVAGPTCQATVAASSIDNGSSDPDGNPLSCALSPPGPFVGAGSVPVTLTCADASGAAAACSATVNVQDLTPPTLVVPPDRTVSQCATTGTVQVGQATATDNCSASTPTGRVISTNGVNLVPPIPVVGGQVTLGIGTNVIEWTVSDGTNTVTRTQRVTVGATIEAGQSFLIDDRGQVRNFGGGFGAVLNAGAGATRVGQDGRTGGVLSRGPVTVQHRAIVSGSVVSGSTVTKDSDATITGTVTQGATVVLPALPAFPPATQGGFTINSGSAQTRGPGSYSAAIVNGGTLTLLAGDYFFQSLTINSGATVRVTPTTRVFVRDTLVFDAPFRMSSGTGVQPIFVGFAGTTLNLFAELDGTLVAPNAAVVFGTGAGLSFTGSFFGRTLEVTPGSSLICR